MMRNLKTACLSPVVPRSMHNNKAQQMTNMTPIVQIMLLLTLSTLLVAPNWQASGFGLGGWFGNMDDNMAPNLPTAYVEIDKAIALGDPSGGNAATMALNISNSLNEMWDPAWNVGIAKLIEPFIDFVVCGYAFRFHWLWHNNYNNLGFSIVIWKDYNCYSWASYASTDVTSSSNSSWASSVESNINSNKDAWATLLSNQGRYPPNIWLAVCRVVSWVDNMATITYSGVGFECQAGTTVSKWAVRFCYDSAGDWVKTTTTVTRLPPFTWTSFVFRTRAGQYGP